MKSVWVLTIVLAFVAGSIVTGAMAYASGDNKGQLFEALWDAIHNLETAVFTAQTCSNGTFMVGINSDGTIVCTVNLDIVVVNNGDGDVSVLLGDGAGSFARTDFAVGVAPFSVAVGDFNGDTDLDLAVAIRFAPDAVSILLGINTKNLFNFFQFSLQ